MTEKLFPNSIKIGAHVVALRTHPAEIDAPAAIEYHIPAITYMERIGRFSEISDVHILHSIVDRIFYAINWYSGINESFEKNIYTTISTAVLEILSRAPWLLRNDYLQEFGPLDPDWHPIYLGPNTLNIIVKENDHASFGKRASVDLKYQEIVIHRYNENRLVTDMASLWQSLWHEIFHAIATSYGLEDFNNNENAIDAFSEWWMMVLIDNPKLVECIKYILCKDKSNGS